MEVQEFNIIDNIDQKVLDILVEKYKDDPNYFISDERKTLSFDKPREYFLIRKQPLAAMQDGVEFTFIWIGDNLWQYRYLNTKCRSQSKWINPTELLNSLINK